jgi:hypothetical protein
MKVATRQRIPPKARMQPRTIPTPKDAFAASSVIVAANPNIPIKIGIEGMRHTTENIAGSASEECMGKQMTRMRPNASNVIPRERIARAVAEVAIDADVSTWIWMPIIARALVEKLIETKYAYARCHLLWQLGIHLRKDYEWERWAEALERWRVSLSYWLERGLTGHVRALKGALVNGVTALELEFRC